MSWADWLFAPRIDHRGWQTPVKHLDIFDNHLANSGLVVLGINSRKPRNLDWHDHSWFQHRY